MNNKISISDFVRNMATKNNLSIAEAKRTTNMVFDSIEEMLLNGNGCSFSIGTFKVSDVKDTEITINFGEKKGEKRFVPAHKKLTFTPSNKIRFAYKNYKANV